MRYGALVSLSIFFVFIFASGNAHAASYCGKTSGTEQGGFAGCVGDVRVMVDGVTRNYGDVIYVSSPVPNISVSGTATSNNTPATICDNGTCVAQTCSISNVRLYLNGTFINYQTSPSLTGSFSATNATYGTVINNPALQLVPGYNTLRVNAEHAYAGRPATCAIATGASDTQGIKVITIIYEVPPIVPAPPDGQIIGRCVGWPTPRVEIEWSNKQPPGALPPTSNGILRTIDGGVESWFFGGGYPGVSGTLINGTPVSPWDPTGYPNPNFAVHNLRDSSVQIGSTYAYRVKYRPEVSSSNVYSVNVSAGNCGGPVLDPAVTLTAVPSSIGPGESTQLTWSSTNTVWCTAAVSAGTAPTWTGSKPLAGGQQITNIQGPTTFTITCANSIGRTATATAFVTVSQPLTLSLTPPFQSVLPNQTAFLNAVGGDGVYTWDTPTGACSGVGRYIGVTYTNGLLTSQFKTVTVHSGGKTATATVEVKGVFTLKDDIDLLGPGNRYILINNDDAVTYDPNVTLTLAHGFVNDASSSITVKLGNTLALAQAATPVPYTKQKPWNLCTGLASCGEDQYTVYAIYANAQGPAAPVLDSILYLLGRPGEPSITINGGAPTTYDREVTLTLYHGFIDIPNDEITMQIGNRPDLVAAATPVLYAPTLTAWDLCDGLGAVCANGTKVVYAKYCARGVCKTLVQDDINLQSLWPDWGVKINEDAPFTDSVNVQLRLNPWFKAPGTVVLVSNLPDLSDATSISYSDTLPWDLCFNRPGPCTPGNYTVYVRYINHNAPTWPGAYSPRYQDSITYVTGTCLPRPVCLDATPACVVTVPVGGWCPDAAPAGILINSGAARTTSRFVTLTFTSPFGAGSQVTMRPVNEGNLTVRDADVIARQFNGGVATAVTGRGPTDLGLATVELESGPERQFLPALGGWDLCQGRVQCPPGLYKVVVQYYKRSSVASAFSSVTRAAIGDLISNVYYDTITYLLAPTTTVTPVVPTPMVPSGVTPLVAPPLTPVPFTSLGSFWDNLKNAIKLIDPLALASAVAVAISVIAALFPLLGPGLLAFTWQWFMGALGLLPKRKKTWGTVYDANTKRPIPFAKVQLLDRNKRVLETRIADKEGRYGFLTTPESLLAKNVQIYIQPSQNGYVFPSRTPAGIDTFVYNNLYYGDLVQVNDKTLINFDVPMDPLHPSHAPLLLKSPSIALGAATAAIADSGFWIGLVMVPLSFALSPNPFTFGTLCLFLGTASLRIFGVAEHPFGIVKDKQTGRPMPFALITLNDLDGKRAGFAVSDERGRYFIVADKGAYEIAVVTPATVVPARQAHQRIDARKGWITRQLQL